MLFTLRHDLLVCFPAQDVGGAEQERPQWSHYYLSAQGVIFVVDASDSARIALAKEVLVQVANDHQLEVWCNHCIGLVPPIDHTSLYWLPLKPDAPA